MQIKIYDEINDYEVDTLNLDNYELDDELLQLIMQIIEDYQDQLD
jgi:hypothetical protein